MEKRLVLRGVLAGALGGFLAFVFARIFAEPRIDAAIRYENGRDAAQALLDRAAGLPVEPPGPDIVSRSVQASVGAGAGMVLFGVAMGALFAVAYTLCLGRVGALRPRTLALLVALGGFVGIYLVPFVKYPANPPSIGHEATVDDRSALYLTMVLSSVVLLVAAVLAGRRLQPRLGNWNASLAGGAVFLATVGAVMAVLPSLGHLPANVAQFGDHATETPLPLRDAHGAIVYPGFPADTLFSFRMYSVAAQAILWAAIGLAFGPLAERLLRPGGTTAARPEPVAAG